MSFLGDIVKSIGSDKAPLAMPKPPSRPTSANATRPTTSTPKPVPQSLPPQGLPSLSGTKRKAEDGSVNINGKAGKPHSAASAGVENRKGPAPPLNAPKQLADKASKLEMSKTSTSPVSKPSPIKASATPASATKAPPSKGSYADLMARAKQTSEQRSQVQAGVIKHQTTIKDKPSKLTERRKAEQEKAKAQKTQKTGNGKYIVKPEPTRSASPQKHDAVKQSKSRTSASKPSYKGTMGKTTSHKRPYQDRSKQSRYDEYLGTDEEDDSNAADEEEGGYDSEGSSDMEAGFDDVEVEERMALRQAKEDDARELAHENELKRTKEERRRKLEQMSAKRR